ncbi:MAG TPA: SDR family oxidoreductase [Candidatus Binatia bacterium]|nr:SDR family oxidoreductase [Candidatus Binatia bacterium]
MPVVRYHRRVPRVLIAGCGDVGTTLGVLLAADGHEVFGLRRRPGGLPAPIRPLAGDLTDAASLTVIPDPVDLVAYTAAADRFDDEAYRRAYVDGIANLLGTIRARGTRPRRMLFTSSTAVYAQTDGGWVDESSPARPTSFSGQRVLQGERLVLASGVRAIVLRLAGIYGPGRTRIVDRVRSGAATCPDGPPRWTNRIHRDDCAGAARHLLTVEEPDPLWLGVDHEPAEECAVLDWLAARLGVLPPRRVPREPGAAGRPETSKRCSNRKLLASGYAFCYPTFRDGYAALVDEDRRHRGER